MQAALSVFLKNLQTLRFLSQLKSYSWYYQKPQSLRSTTLICCPNLSFFLLSFIFFSLLSSFLPFFGQGLICQDWYWTHFIVENDLDFWSSSHYLMGAGIIGTYHMVLGMELRTSYMLCKPSDQVSPNLFLSCAYPLVETSQSTE